MKWAPVALAMLKSLDNSWRNLALHQWGMVYRTLYFARYVAKSSSNLQC